MQCKCGHRSGQTCLFEHAKMKLYSKEWFDACFEDVRVTKQVRTAAERIVQAFGIEGLTDPGYIANIISDEVLK